MEKADFLYIANKHLVYGLVNTNNIFTNSQGIFRKIVLLQAVYDYWEEVKKAIKEGSQDPYNAVDVGQVAYQATKETILQFDGFKEYLEEAGKEPIEQFCVLFIYNVSLDFDIYVSQLFLSFLTTKHCTGYEGKEPSIQKELGPNEYYATSPLYKLMSPMEYYPVKEAQSLLCPSFPEVDNVIQKLTWNLYNELDKVNRAVVSNAQEEQRAVLGFSLEDVKFDAKSALEKQQKALEALMEKLGNNTQAKSKYPEEQDENLRELSQGTNPPILPFHRKSTTLALVYYINDIYFSREEVERRIGCKKWAKLANTKRLYLHATSEKPITSDGIQNHLLQVEKKLNTLKKAEKRR